MLSFIKFLQNVISISEVIKMNNLVCIILNLFWDFSEVCVLKYMLFLL